MANRHRISCITRKIGSTGAHERITHVGGISNGKQWKLTVGDAIEGIQANPPKWEFYVLVGGYREVDVIVARRNGRDYLKTEADGDEPNNLLSLDACP
jgi:hypothetical protein